MNSATFSGILAILFWSTNVAFARSLTEQMGVLTSGAVLFVAGGIIALSIQGMRERSFNFILRSSPKYLFGCGLLFVANTTALQVAIGLSTSREQTLVVALINYLWTVCSLVFSIFLLNKAFRPWLWLGIILALAGMALATTGGDLTSIQVAFRQPGTLVVYGLAIIAALTWGFYSNLSRKWASDQDGGSVPLFMLCAGLAMGALRLAVPEHTGLDSSTVLELAYMIVFPTILAYSFWDLAMRKGRMITVVSLSYFIPLFSTIISSLKLNVSPGIATWLAAGLIICGAWVCKTAIPE